MTDPSGARTRVVMLIDRLIEGGAERLLVALAANLPPDRYEVFVWTTRPSLVEWEAVEQRRIATLLEAGVKVFSLKRRHRLDLLAFWRLTAFLRQERIDVIHTHMFGSNFWGTLFGRLARTPVIVAHEHTWSYESQPLRKLVDGYFIGRLASTFTCGSKLDRDRMIALEHVPSQKVVMIPNAYFPRPRSMGDLRSELGIPPGDPVVGTLAQLREQKALHVLIDAFAILSRQRPDAHLVIGGNGPCRAMLEQRVRHRGLDGRAHFLGQREDVDVVLAGLDVAVMTSDYEATSLFALECMAHGAPLVSTAVGGINDLVTDRVHALLTPPRDSEAVATAVEEMLRDRSLREAIVSRARERLEEFTIERFVMRYDELYQRLLSGERASR